MVKHVVDGGLDVEALLAKLTLEEKISLLCGQGSFKTTSLPAHGIPSITVSLRWPDTRY